MIRLPLTKGYEALIDDRDAHLAAFKWTADVRPNGIVYARRLVGGRKVYLHRAVMRVEERHILVDHRNGDGRDCRRDNLRVGDKSLNAHNGGVRSDNTSGYRGVSFKARFQKWDAKIEINGREKYLGRFSTPEAANAARLAYEAKTIGIHPRREDAFA